MYSGSRGILYTAPPGPDESNDENADANATSETPDDSPVTSSTESDELAADD